MHTFMIRWTSMHSVLLLFLCFPALWKYKNTKRQGRRKGGLISMSENIQHTCKKQLKSQIAATDLLRS